MNRPSTVLLGLLLWAGAAVSRGADVAPLLHDTQVTRSENGKLLLVWWIPDEFWEISFKDNPATPPAAQKEVLEIVHEYMVFAVVEGTISPLGELHAESKPDLFDKFSIVINKKELKPIADEDLADAAKTLFQTMKPVLANTAGKIGQSMEFFVFEGLDGKGKRLADPTAKGMLTAKIGSRELKWRLPLGSLLPPKYDAATSEEFPGNFEFSPFTGAKLSADKPAPK